MKKFSLSSASPVFLAASVACVSAVWAAPAWAFTPFTVKNIEIRGLEHIAPGTVYNYLPIHIGEQVDDQKAQQAIKDLYSTGFFKDVTIARSDDNLLVIVQERPIISSIKMEGIKAFSKSEVNGTLKGVGLVERHIFNRSILDQVVHGLQEQYEGMGYYNAKIHARVIKLPRNRVAIHIDAKEGEQATIKQVTIVGNHAFSESRLRGLFSIGAPDAFSFFSKNNRYSREKLMKGLEKLHNYYLDRGYLNFDVESSQVQVTPDRRFVYITVNVHEGSLYHIQSVHLSGDLVVPKPELEKLMEIRAGDVFSRAKINDTNSAIAEKLGNLGYAFANTTPVPKVDAKTHEVALNFEVNPGRKVYIRRIEITGNDKSRDYVVRRQFRQMEGALYDGALIRRSKLRLQQTGFYDKINTKTVPVPGHPDQLDLDVDVSERPTGSFSIGVGYSNAQGILFNGSISQNNFMGTGNALSFSANVGGLGTAYNLSFTDPYVTPDGISLGFSLYRNNTNLSILSVAPYQEIDYGGTATLGIPVMQYIYDYMSLGFSNTTINLFANPPAIYSQYVQTFGNTATALTVGNALTFDSRNSPIFPTKGFYGSLALKAAVPPAKLRWYKAEIKADYYHPITSWLTGGLSGRYGFINGYGGLSVPFFNNYYMGGPTTLPGYQTYSLGPQVGGYPVGGTRELLFNASLYFPLPGLADNNNFRMSLFAASGWVYGVNSDASGNNYSYNNQYFPSLGQMRTTVGVGFLWISPMGPLRLSLAVPLNRHPNDLTQPLQFTVGNNF
ncbi:MAG: outer membrane protein assembly factor BamA [Acidithiobacillus ferriphilus]|uniref:Outer membrane protein assembly factor BamA n=8 Tax=Acidithiobacillus TaxID=119977 RepID=A0A179B9Z9_ACIFR|nr:MULTISPECIES: outer membrane protein assembly factor BamA [Acidithiobacillus]MDA8151322.1 outer membrane protein assembly factor BamA [Acidithiobacillus sp.]MBU2827172.1 outer membrane protein assembly factor BamA [Acidithiobacillus ferriphilus]MBU2832742.1 outer membrane protein assembly factor BamA [Acidithiobacillus ferriphilus]MBU2845577.1 outer membrane protein assembly factor BamA [Acidithiobacillus ferriphilus]MBU2854166.1 outer membrane protein assembly factor BamA [Acidithiobacillu